MGGYLCRRVPAHARNSGKSFLVAALLRPCSGGFPVLVVAAVLSEADVVSVWSLPNSHRGPQMPE